MSSASTFTGTLSNASQAALSHADAKAQTPPPHMYHDYRVKLFKSLMSNGHQLYTPEFKPDVSDVAAFKKRWDFLEKGKKEENTEHSVRGRIVFIRSSGERLRFYVIQVGEEQLQVVGQFNDGSDIEDYKRQHEHLGRGDIIGVIGHPGRTSPRGDRPGEVSLFARQIVLLAPCLWTVPKDSGLTDPEQRHRNRALDLIVNRRSREMLRMRHRMNSFIRNYLDSNGYIEAETPILAQRAGGASAKPFITYHNDLKRDLFLRIATELSLKPLIVGGMERVYELGRVFRNEDIDLTHNPEFSSCEFYQAGADYETMMALTEDMISNLIKSVTGSYVTTYTTQAGETHEINWQVPWKRVVMMPALEQACQVQFPHPEELHTEASRKFLLHLLDKLNIVCSPPQTCARMLDKLVGEYIESACINPTFITHHPKMMSPLARQHRSYSGLTERAEAFVCKREICNLFTELNDPFEQRERFLEQARQKDQGDDEAQLIDEDFCRALEYGLPPTGGCGLGLDRILMFLTNQYSIKEVLAYPMMREASFQNRS
ncbi:MAG: hypothetical protein Q9227_001440 [Pyrenula ochraceoflavens]